MNKKHGKDTELRQRAEARFRKTTAQSPAGLASHSPEDIPQMLHELRVHQIELEMQNEELRGSQVALDAVRARYFDLYDLAPVGYCTVSEQGLILQANLTAASMLGMPRGALVKQPLSRLILKEDQDIYYLHRKRLVESGEPLSCELRMVRQDGTRFWVHLAITAAHAADGAPELRAVLSDISTRKQVEEERIRLDQALHEKNAELESAWHLADKANRAKSDFLSSMSHELRTPLNAILGFAQLIEAGSPPPTPSQQRSLDQILKGGWYLLELINEILDLALIESGKVTLSHEPVSLAEVMLECQSMIERLAQKHGIGLTFPRFEIPCFVNADRTRLKQVLINLLSNAIKYNKPNGTVAVECTTSPSDSIRIGIRDSGEGLAPAQLAQLFQSFNRLGREGGAEEGTGIGLVVTKKLVELMGGVIGVDSTVGAGSVFWIELILSTAPQLMDPEAEHAAQVPTQVPEARPLRTLLYVEDNPANLELVEQLIERRSDLRLLSAANGNLGIELARAHQPEVILMDIKLPGLSGIEAMTILRADPSTAHIPIIAISANAVDRDIKIGIAAGFFDYLTKPIRVNQFMDTLDSALAFAKTEESRAA